MDLQLSREEKERLLQQVADAAFEDALNKMDAAASRDALQARYPGAWLLYAR